MSATPSTPRANPSKLAAPAATPTPTRVSGSHALQSSPYYTSTRRHSLYGTEDRVVIDPGSRIWKVGFSGEGKPRDIFYVNPVNLEPLWSWNRAIDPSARAEEDRVLEINIERCMRSVFHKSLLTDPKSRKVVLVEHPLLPLYIKDALAKVLFGNLQVPSVSFASSHLLSLLSVGRITGLVVDCGHLESTALPIFAARPLFPHLRTTPLAGLRLTSHLRALLLLFGTYIPPPPNLSSMNPPLSSRAGRVPQEILTDALVEDIKTRCCFVSATLEINRDSMRSSSPAPASESDLPLSSDAAMSESEFSRASESEGVESVTSSRHASSEFERSESGGREGYLQVLANIYTRHSSATDIRLRVVPPASQQLGTGRGTLIIPGWIRERAAEVLFEGGDVDESSVAEVLLETLLKVPIDLRQTLVSSILVTGGTAMLPGFIPRLHAELLRTIGTAASPRPRQGSTRSGRPLPPAYDRYAALRPLVPHIAILDDPAPKLSSSSSPSSPSSRATANAGKAPAFAPALMAWVGGSLAGALKTGGVEVLREKWDDAFSSQVSDNDNEGDDDEDDEDDDAMESAPLATSEQTRPRGMLPDWTRTPLSVGAPPAAAGMGPQARAGPVPQASSPQTARVGA